jgi:hypothetical protein
MSSEADNEESKAEHNDCLHVDLKREFTALINITKFYESLDTIDDSDEESIDYI